MYVLNFCLFSISETTRAESSLRMPDFLRSASSWARLRRSGVVAGFLVLSLAVMVSIGFGAPIMLWTVCRAWSAQVGALGIRTRFGEPSWAWCPCSSVD